MKPKIVVGEVEPADFLQPSERKAPTNLSLLWHWIDPDTTRTPSSKVYRGIWQYHIGHKKAWPAAIYGHPRTLIGVRDGVSGPIPIIRDNTLPEGIIFFAHPGEAE